MATPSTIEEIQTYKTQLNEFLSKKFIDQSLLLGFNNVLQSKFQTLILSDCNDYYDNVKAFESLSQNDVPNNQLDLEFKTIKIFEILWTEFHYPIVKFFQFHHATYYNEFSKKVFESSGKDKSLRAVEIRKINDNFNKFIKQVYQFYFALLKHFSTHFQNPLIPDTFLAHFEFVVPNNAIRTFNANLQANLIFLIHRCLLSLGDISRHRSFMEISYVNPCLSIKNFWKYHHLANLSIKEKFLLMKPSYEKALNFYKFCILLLPALNEPYNHIGMIYNLMDSKYDACYWFLRSHFTRLPNYKLGLTNLNTILRKDWFINHLISFNNPNKKNKTSVSKIDELNITLICLICHYYDPENYHESNSTIAKNLKYSKIEGNFFKELHESFDKFIRTYEEQDLNFYVKQLVILMSFNKLIELRSENSISEQFIKFTFRYINKLLESCASVELDYKTKRVIFIILRLLFNWFKENKVILRNFQARKSVMMNIITLLNKLISDMYSDELHSRDINREKISELIRLNSRPVRDYYFKEDVYFRDFLIIKFQLKDFKDDHIFASNNINLLVGDYSSLKDKDSLVPSFLDNNFDRQLIDNNKNDDKSNKIKSQLENSASLDIEIIHYENNLRLQSVILLSKKLLEYNPYGIDFDYNEGRFIISDPTIESMDVQVQDSQVESESKSSDQKSKSDVRILTKQKEHRAKSARSRKSKNEHTPRMESEKEGKRIQVENSSDKININDQGGIQIPNTLQELNSFILNHSSQLQDKLLQSPSDKILAANSSTDDILTQDSQRDNGLKNMVDSLVLESSNSEPKSINSGTQNIWKNGVNNEVVNSETPSQSFNMLNSNFSNTSTPNDHPMYSGIPMASQMTQGAHVSPNYSQVFQQPYPQYFNPFPNQFPTGGSTPYYRGVNDRFMPMSSQLLLHSIPSSLPQPIQGASQSPMHVASASPVSTQIYPQYGQMYNQFMGPPQHMQPPLPPQPQPQHSEQQAKEYGSTHYPS